MGRLAKSSRIWDWNFNRAVEVWRMVEFDGVRRLQGTGRIVVTGAIWINSRGDMKSAHATVIAEHEFELVNDANLKVPARASTGIRILRRIRGIHLAATATVH